MGTRVVPPSEHLTDPTLPKETALIVIVLERRTVGREARSAKQSNAFTVPSSLSVKRMTRFIVSRGRGHPRPGHTSSPKQEKYTNGNILAAGTKFSFATLAKPSGKNNKEDFQFVMARIKQETDLEMTDVKVNESGIAQISFGKDKGCGSIQLYLTKNSRADGNVHLNFGPNNVERLKEIRKVLLRSAWFQETAGMYMRPADKSIEKAMINDTRVPFFFVRDDTRELEPKKFISLIMVHVGMEAKKALLEYYRIHGLEANHIVYTMIDREFRE